MNRSSTSPRWQVFRRVYWSLTAIWVAVLVLLAAMGFGPGGRNCQAAAVSTAAAAPDTSARTASTTVRVQTPTSCGWAGLG